MKPCCRSFWLLSSFSVFWLATSSTKAQIVQDATLPNPSIVTVVGNTNIITGGTQAGSNLFHSFKEFSVSNGGASFQQIEQGIKNVLTRVTGSNVSNINGLISVLQANGTVSSANFFLLNPNGIIFGPNARLNIGGSFLASTASSLNFADGTMLGTTNSPTTQPLLTVSVPIGLQFGGSAASIQVQGARLQVPQTLGLVGGNVTLVGGRLTAAGGRIVLGSVAGVTPDTAPVKVSLTPIDKGWALGYEGIQNFQDIQLSQQAILNASGSGGGDIQVQGRRVTLTAGSQMVANTQGSAPGGTLAVAASESVELSGISASGVRSALSTRVEEGATGAGGNLTIETGRLLVRDGAQVLTSTFGQGQAGNLTVQNATEVELVGGTVAANGNFISSGLFTQTAAKATEAGGNLSISAGKLIVRDGAQVNSTSFGVGRAGDLTVQATDVELVGDAISTDGQLLTNQIGLPFPSGLFAGTGIGSTGDGGTLTVETNRLSLRDGAVVQTSTLGAGNAGFLIVQATDAVEVIGKAADGQFPSSLLAVSGGIPGFPGVIEAKGRGGDLTIKTGKLIVRDGAAVAVSSLNPASDALGGAGSLQIQARTIRLNNQAAITAETASGNGGDIKLQAQDLLLLRRNSEISTTAGTAGAGGNGGNITINTPFIVAVPSENSDLTANAFKGAGGRVKINAQEVFGLEYREALTPLSDITAFSQQNPELNGVVEINTPDVDPNKGLVALPAAIVDASRLIAQGCGAGDGTTDSQFKVTGRGGLPPNPEEVFSSDAVWEDLRLPFVHADERADTVTNPQVSSPTTVSIVPATGWVFNGKGEVTLTAQVPDVTPNIPWMTPASCHTP